MPRPSHDRSLPRPGQHSAAIKAESMVRDLGFNGALAVFYTVPKSNQDTKSAFNFTITLHGESMCLISGCPSSNARSEALYPLLPASESNLASSESFSKYRKKDQQPNAGRVWAARVT
eukprot:1313082-Rhodomonas_salina.1